MPSNKTDLAKLLADLDDLEQRRLGPLYNSVARDLKRAVEKDGLQGLQRAYSTAIKTLTTEQGLVVTMTVRHAAQMAGMNNAEIHRLYPEPPPGQRFIPGLSQPITLDEIQDVLPNAVADRMLTTIDKWNFRLSDRIWRNASKTRNEMLRYLVDHQRDKGRVSDAIEQLQRFQLDDTQLPRHMRVLEKAARDALQNTPGAKQKFLDELRRSRKYVEGLTPGQRGTRKFQREVLQKMRKAVETGSDQTIREAIDLFVKQRGRYRAQVLIQNTGNITYQSTNLDIYIRSPYVMAIQWRFSPSHRHIDSCDLRARADMGWGPGIYAKGENIPWPVHPPVRLSLRSDSSSATSGRRC